MAIVQTIGSTGADHSTIESWLDYLIAKNGSFTDDEVGLLIKNEVYAPGTASKWRMSAINHGAHSITLIADDGSTYSGTGSGTDVRHTGDFGTGARVVASVAANSLAYPEQMTIVDVEFYNTSTSSSSNCFGAMSDSQSTYITRCLFKTDGTGTSYGINAGTNGVIAEACRFESCVVGFLSTSGAYSLKQCSALNCGTGFSFTNTGTHSGDIINNVAFNCSTAGWASNAAGYSGSVLNNASDDATEPTGGTTVSGVVSGDFEADGYTPTTGSSLDATGATSGVVTGADHVAYESPPSVGAYEATAPVGTIEITGVFWDPPTGWGFVTYDGSIITPNSIMSYATGTHTGSDASADLVDSASSWTDDLYNGFIVKNLTNGESATITDTVDATNTVVGTLSGSETWDTGDEYQIILDIASGDQIVYETTTNLGGTVSLSVSGIPIITGSSGTHTFDVKYRDISDSNAVSSTVTVTVTV